MANTTWKQVVYDVADAYREANGTTAKIAIGDLPNKVKEGGENIDTELTTLESTLQEILEVLPFKGSRTEGEYVWVKSTKPGVINYRLPEGYTEVEYIEATGTQYIDFGISVPCSSEKVIVEFSPTTEEVDNVLCGHAAPSWSWGSNLMFVLDKRLWTANTGIGGIDINVGEFYKVEYTSSYCKVNDGASNALNSLTYTDGYNNTLFYASTKFGKQRAKIYQLYNGSTLVRCAISCIANSSGEVGMYDLVEGKFYGNSGTGVFLAGRKLDIAYVVGNDINAYPNGGMLDGYWYELVENFDFGVEFSDVMGLTRFATNTFVFSTKTRVDAPVYHSLGTVPKFALMLAKGSVTEHGCLLSHIGASMVDVTTGLINTALMLYRNTSVTQQVSTVASGFDVTATQIWVDPTGYYFQAGVEYMVITGA